MLCKCLTCLALSAAVAAVEGNESSTPTVSMRQSRAPLFRPMNRHSLMDTSGGDCLTIVPSLSGNSSWPASMLRSELLPTPELPNTTSLYTRSSLSLGSSLSILLLVEGVVDVVVALLCMCVCMQCLLQAANLSD